MKFIIYYYFTFQSIGLLIFYLFCFMRIKYLLSLALIFLTHSYDTRLSLQLAVISSIVMGDPALINNWTCSRCKQFNITDAKAFDNQTLWVQGLSAYNHDRNAIIIAFRGSDDIKNWILDFDFIQINYKRCSGCKIHQGFYLLYNSIIKLFIEDVQNLIKKYPNSEIMLTGHSLGAALATFAALDIADTFKSSITFYTFGQPRIGNKQFCQHFEHAITKRFRIIHNADIVPHVPPQYPIIYSHFGQQIWYTQHMTNYQECKQNGEDPHCSDSINLNQLSSSDHSISNYLMMKP